MLGFFLQRGLTNTVDLMSVYVLNESWLYSLDFQLYFTQVQSSLGSVGTIPGLGKHMAYMISRIVGIPRAMVACGKTMFEMFRHLGTVIPGHPQVSSPSPLTMPMP